MPAPATCPRFQPEVEPVGPIDPCERVDPCDGEAIDLEHLVVRERTELSDVAAWRHHEMPGRVRVLVQERDGRLARAEEE